MDENKDNMNIKNRKSAKKVICIVAAILVAVLAASGIYRAVTAPPDTSVVNGELYTFKSNEEIKHLVKSLNAGSDKRLLGTGDIETNVEVYEEDASTESAGPKLLTNSASDSDDSSSHSETYLQVDEVDEADIVKTDGKYIYYVNGNQEVVILSANAGETEKISTVGAGSIDNYVQDIYLKDDILITVGRYYKDDDNGSAGIVIYDISDRSNPAMISDFSQSGNVVTSRMVGSYLYLLTEYYVYSQDNCIPMCGTGDSYSGLAPSSISCMPNPKSCSFIVLSAIDISSGKDLSTATRALFGATDDIYCNDHNLYSFSGEWDSQTGEDLTRIARAGLDGLSIEFDGTAAVRGIIANRFAMDESDGYLRVATTSQRNGIDVNNLYVLDSALEESGKVTGFARNESIKAVRYIGSKAYVITYEAIDPLFIIDLADPADPRIEGEVMIDGFSTLLVPAGEGKLLGIGHATGDNGYGGEYDSGLKLTLFDISNQSQPSVIASREFENMTSPAQSDSHALTVNSDAGYYAIPYGIDNYDLGNVLIEEDFIEDAEESPATDNSAAQDSESGYEAGILVFRADDSFDDAEQHFIGREYLLRSVFIDDYIYALDTDGNCSAFQPESVKKISHIATILD